MLSDFTRPVSGPEPVSQSVKSHFIHVAQNHSHTTSLGFKICTATLELVRKSSSEKNSLVEGGKKKGRNHRGRYQTQQITLTDYLIHAEDINPLELSVI